MQVTKVWWDGEKLMAEPIDPAAIYKEPEHPAQQDSTCNKTLLAQGKAYPRTCKKCGFGPCIADRVQPAQQWQSTADKCELEKVPANGSLLPAQQNPVAWKNAAIRLGEDLCSVGPFGYYDMTAEQWLDWALSVVTVHAPPAQPLTDERIFELASEHQDWDRNLIRVRSFARAIEAAHGIKGDA